MEDRYKLQDSEKELVSAGNPGGEIIITSNPPVSPPFELNKNCPKCGSSNCTFVRVGSFSFDCTCNDCGYAWKCGLS